MKLIGSLIVFVLVAPINAQTAKVIALSPADAAEAKDLYAQRDAINKKIEQMQHKIEDHYLSETKPGPANNFTASGPSFSSMCATKEGFVTVCPETEAEKKANAERIEKEKKMTHLERIDGWFSFEFSEDFKYIVPTKAFPVNTTGIFNGCGINSAGPAWVAN